jgi:hypothetical protein
MGREAIHIPMRPMILEDPSEKEWNPSAVMLAERVSQP